MKITKNVWSEIIRYVITLLSAVGASLSLDSCTNYAPVNSQPVHETPVTQARVEANADVACVDTIFLESSGFNMRYLE